MKIFEILFNLISNNSLNNQQLMNYIIIGLLVFILVLLGITLFTNKN